MFNSFLILILEVLFGIIIRTIFLKPWYCTNLAKLLSLYVKFNNSIPRNKNSWIKIYISWFRVCVARTARIYLNLLLEINKMFLFCINISFLFILVHFRNEIQIMNEQPVLELSFRSVEVINYTCTANELTYYICHMTYDQEVTITSS